MDNKDKIDKIFESVEAKELLSWAKIHAYVDDKFALAVLDKFWKPEQEDEKALVEKCFMHPSYLQGQKYSWIAIEEDLTKLMPALEKMYEEGEWVRAAYLAGYIMTFTCKAYSEDFYTQYQQHIRPVMDCVVRAEEIVRAILIDGEQIDEDSRIGILSEIVEECEKVQDSPLFRVERFLEEAYRVTMPMKEYITFINKLLRRKRDYYHDFHVVNKAKCLLKNGCWNKAKEFLDKEIGNENVRIYYVDLLIEHGEFKRALEIAEKPDSTLHDEEWIARQLNILDLIKEDKLTIEFCRSHFLPSYHRWEYYKRLKKTVPESEWKIFLEDLLRECEFNCDVDRAEIRIYIEEGMLDRVYPYCERKGEHSVIENLKNYSQYLEEAQQIALTRLYSDWVIQRSQSDDLKRRRDYEFIARWVKDLAQCSPVGAKEAKKLVHTLLEIHSSRPALTSELRSLHLL